MVARLCVALVLLTTSAADAGGPPKLLRQPTLSATSIAFAHGGDLWVVDRSGGRARRLTAGQGLELGPRFSPDGTRVAFTGQYDGNLDVFVVPATGGVPRRLTYHPGADLVVGWSPDGERVLFRSARDAHSRYARLFTVALTGGLPEPLPLPTGVQGAYSPDGRRIAYLPFWNRRGVPGAYIAWKRYRGGKASPIWIADLKDSSIQTIPRTDSNDSDPMWVADSIYFLSDRDGGVELYAYGAKTKQVKRLTEGELDIGSASAGPGGIVYERFGQVFLLDPATGKSTPVPIQVDGDLPGVRPRFAKVAELAVHAGLSPSGARAVFEARGEIWTVPAEKGDVRNLTRSAGAADRDPAWSPDGKWIACLSDAGGEYALHLLPQDGHGQVRRIGLGDPPSFYYQPVWSPDSASIALHDKRLQLWVVRLKEGRKTLVDSDTYDSPWRTLDPAWSPDSRYLAYTRQEPSHLRAVWIFDTRSGKRHRVTDGMGDARSAVFDRDGKHLYFLASTDAAPTLGWIDLSSINRPITRSAWVVVLSDDDPSPLEPLSDEERPAEDKADENKKDGKAEPPPVKIDFDGIDQRTLALPVQAKNYVDLQAGGAGVIFLVEGGPVPEWEPTDMKVSRFTFDKRKAETLFEGLSVFRLSGDGKKALYKNKEGWFISGADKAPEAGKGKLNLDGMRMRVDPVAEWRQMYEEVWRIQRDFLYDPNAHGLDLKKTAARYRPYLAGLRHRLELSELFAEMLGHLVLGHTYIAAGDLPAPPKHAGGLLGADYEVHRGRYRFARIFDGENWNPKLKAPLTQPGVNVKQGEYLLAVDGEPLFARDNPHAALEGTAGRSVRLTVGPRPDGKRAREVDVVPVADEWGLRHRAWVEANRRKVEALSGGKVGYVYLPNTAGDGYSSFNRYYFAQVGSQAMVLDERFNGGGLAADYIVDHLRRPLLNYWTAREGQDFRTPAGSVLGPQVMIINETAGSGGDALPWYFRRLGLGKLVGTRTWGGLVGIYDYPQLIDGGFVTAPRMAFWSPDGKWDVENHGVDPDIEVVFDPAAWRAGRDPQLERAVQVVLDELKKNPPPKHQRPAYPNHHRK